MATSKDTFLIRFPEFEGAPDSMIKEAMAEAVRNVDPCVFNDKTDDAVYWKTAHLLAITPFGQNARMVSKEGKTTYGRRFHQLALSVTPGFRVA